MNEVKIFLLKHPIKLILDQQPARTSAHYCHWFQNLLFFDVKRKLVSRLNYIEYRYYMSMSSTLFNQTDDSFKVFLLVEFHDSKICGKNLFQKDFVLKNVFVSRRFCREDFFQKYFCKCGEFFCLEKIFLRILLFQEDFCFYIEDFALIISILTRLLLQKDFCLENNFCLQRLFVS